MAGGMFAGHDQSGGDVVEENGKKLRNFSLVSLDNNQVTNVSFVWVDNNGAIATEECLYKQPVLSPIY